MATCEIHVDLKDKNLRLFERPGSSVPFVIGLGLGDGALNLMFCVYSLVSVPLESKVWGRRLHALPLGLCRPWCHGEVGIGGGPTQVIPVA